MTGSRKLVSCTVTFKSLQTMGSEKKLNISAASYLDFQFVQSNLFIANFILLPNVVVV